MCNLFSFCHPIEFLLSSFVVCVYYDCASLSAIFQPLLFKPFLLLSKDSPIHVFIFSNTVQDSNINYMSILIDGNSFSFNFSLVSVFFGWLKTIVLIFVLTLSKLQVRKICEIKARMILVLVFVSLWSILHNVELLGSLYLKLDPYF